MQVNYKKYFEPAKFWCDEENVPIQAHGAGILYDEKTKCYYMYGEERTYGYYNFVGVSVYSSKDLYTWENEGVALKSGDFPEKFRGVINRDGKEAGGAAERPKVIYNDKTEKYVMWIHLDAGGYKVSQAGVAVSDSPTGPFKLIKNFRPIKYDAGYKNDDYASQNLYGGTYRDMNLFKDDDGTAYVIYSSEGNATMYIARLNDEYTDIDEVPELGKNWTRNFIGESREAPAPFKCNGRYYIITSACTGWAPNKAKYAVADSMLGPWKDMGDPTVGDIKNTTFDSQSTYVLPAPKKPGSFVFMADRWNPTNLSDSRYIWLPLTVDTDTDKVTIEWKDRWSY